MKIAIFTDTYLPLINGVSIHLNLSIQEFIRAGHEVMLFTPKFPKNHIDTYLKKQNGFIHVQLHSLPFFLYEDFRLAMPYSITVFNRIRTWKPDVIHVHTPLSVGMNGNLMGQLFQIPVIGTFHTYFMEEEYLKNFFPHTVVKRGKRILERAGWQYAHTFYKKCAAIVTPTTHTKRDLELHKFRQPIHVISNGTRTDVQPELRLTKKLFKKTIPPYFLYVGRVSTEKSVDILLHALSALEHDVHMIIVGAGPELPRMKRLASDLQIAQQVHFTGAIEHSRLLRSDLYSHATAFVTASKSETQGISLLEAMSFGVPVIGVASRGVTELLTSCGILVKPDNSDELKSAMMAMLGRRRAEYVRKTAIEIQKHALSMTVEKLLGLYNTVAQVENK